MKRQAQEKNDGIVDPLSKESIEKEVAEAFKKYDVNNDGVLSRDEAKEYIKKWVDKAAKLKTQERPWYKKLLPGQNAGNKIKKAITFDDIDTNNDGYISKQELTVFIIDQRMLHSE